MNKQQTKLDNPDIFGAPPGECDGYPPVLVPTDIDDVSFYVPVHPCSTFPTTRNGDSRLACSLIKSNGDIHAKKLGGKHQSPLVVDRRKPVVILCHGFLSWRNQMLIYHLAAGIAKELNCHTLRFDFTGNGHSGGTWDFGDYDREQRDLKSVVNFVQTQLECQVCCILGHSKGATAAMRYAWEQEQDEEQDEHAESNSSPYIPCFVNLAGRYFVPGMVSSIMDKFTTEQKDKLKAQGQFEWKQIGGRKCIVTQEAIDKRRKHDMSNVAHIKSAIVLTIHGDDDCTVPVSNAYQFDDEIAHHELLVIPGAQHNFNGLKHVKKLVSTVADFLRSRGV